MATASLLMFSSIMVLLRHQQPSLLRCNLKLRQWLKIKHRLWLLYSLRPSLNNQLKACNK